LRLFLKLLLPLSGVFSIDLNLEESLKSFSGLFEAASILQPFAELSSSIR
jgi:hypothetical protein